MSSQQMVGVVLLVVGVIAILVGMNASNSIADQVSNTFTGRFTQATTWYLIGGIASALLGALLVFVKLGGKLA